jgi:hypothetical protein
MLAVVAMDPGARKSALRNDEERRHLTVITAIASSASMNSKCNNCFAVPGFPGQR